MQTAVIALDSKQLTIILKKMLEDLGFTCFATDTAEQLISFVKEKKAEVLFTDWALSGQDIETILPKLPSVPTHIFVSKEKSPEIIQKALDLGAREYIMKPFDNDILQSKLSLAGLL